MLTPISPVQLHTVTGGGARRTNLGSGSTPDPATLQALDQLTRQIRDEQNRAQR